MNTFEKIKEIIDKSCKVDLEINLSSLFKEDLGIDSLEYVKILMDCEMEWDISIDDDKASDMKTINDLVECINELVKNE